MTIKISIELLIDLVFRLAEYIGPVVQQYVIILRDFRLLIDVDWEILAQFFSSSQPDLVREVCFRATDRGLSDMSKLTDLIKEVQDQAEMF